MPELEDIPEFIALASRGPGALDFAAQPSNVNHGPMWTVDTQYGSCYWRAWVKPIYPNLLGYYISDGSGGQHTVLTGVSCGASTFIFTGNIYDGTDIWSLSSSDTIPLGEWVHYEFVYDDGVNMYALLNGICTFYGKLTQGGAWTSAFTGKREFNPGGSDGNCYVGGSFHNNFPGLIKAVEGVEGSACGVSVENRFVPKDYNGYVTNALGSSVTRASLSASYTVPGTRSFIDMGTGFDSRIHHGMFSRYDDATAFPTWTAGEVEPSTYIPTPPSTPSGALVFDSFSRVNNLELFDNLSSLGTTEAGSLGTKTWQTPYFDDSNRGAGVLYGQAVLYTSLITHARITLDRTNVDIRVTRASGKWGSTGILTRLKDGDNYYAVEGYDTSIVFEFKESGVTTFPAGFTVTTGWSVLRVVMNGTTMEVFVDGTSAGTKTVINDALALDHGIARAGAVARYDDFTIFAV